MDRLDGPPVVVKLLEGTQGIGVILAETAMAASSVIEAFHGLDQNILIQKFIAEAKGADIRAWSSAVALSPPCAVKRWPASFAPISIAAAQPRRPASQPNAARRPWLQHAFWGCAWPVSI